MRMLSVLWSGDQAVEDTADLAGHCYLQRGPGWYWGLEQQIGTVEGRPDASVVAVRAVLVL